MKKRQSAAQLSISSPLPVSNSVKIGQAAKILGVSIDSLRRWERSGKLNSIKTPGGTRFYSLDQLKSFTKKSPKTKTTSQEHPLVEKMNPRLEDNRDNLLTNAIISEENKQSLISTENETSLFSSENEKSLSSNQKKEDIVSEYFVTNSPTYLFAEETLGSFAEEVRNDSFNPTNKIEFTIVEDELNLKPNLNPKLANFNLANLCKANLCKIDSIKPKIYILSSSLTVVTLLLTGAIYLSYLTIPQQTLKFFNSQQPSFLSNILSPFNNLAKSSINTILPSFGQTIGILDNISSLSANTDALAIPAILAESTLPNYLQINADTNITAGLAVDGEGVFIGNLTAPNIIYDILPGDNVSITEGQTPTISVDLPTIFPDTLTINGVLYGQGSEPIKATPAGSSGQFLVANSSSIPTFVTLSGDATLSSSGELTISSDAVTLGTDTSGDYVKNITAGNGITVSVTSGEASTPAIGLDVTTSSTTTTTSANSGLEVDSSGLSLLRGCSNNQMLLWDGTSSEWECGSISSSGVSGSGTAGQVAFFDSASSITSETSGFTWDSTNNRLGIGTSSPAYPLQVNGTAPDISDGRIMDIDGNLTSTTNDQSGFKISPAVVPGSNTTRTYSGGVFSTSGNSTTRLTGATLRGFDAQSSFSGASGTLGTAMGGRYLVNNTGGGTITNTYGIRIDTPVNSGTLTNTRGIYIQSQAAGTQTNRAFGLYQEGSSDDNYFAGNVGIGDTSPSSPLEVGNGTDSLQVSSVGDITFVDANDGASITGPAGGALSIAAANSQALNLTTTTAGNISLDPAGAGDISLVTANGSGSNLNITGLTSGTGSALCVDGSSNVVTCTVGSGGVSGSGTAGQVAFFDSASSITSETSGFTWDSTNDRLGIGTTDPAYNLQVGDETSATSQIITIMSDLDAGLILGADDDNTNENDNPYIKMIQDGTIAAGVSGVIGLTHTAQDPSDESAFTDVLANALLISNNYSASNGIQFGTHNGTSKGVRMTLNKEGNLGIGDTTPTEANLVIAGSADGTDALYLTVGDILVNNGDLDILDGDFNVDLDAGDGVNITKGAAPTVDVFSINGGTSATSGVDGLQLTFGTSNVSGNVIDITPSFAGGATDTLTYNIIDIDAFSPTNAAGTDIVNAIAIGNLTDPGATITSTALNIGSGFDNEIYFEKGSNDLQFRVTAPTGATRTATIPALSADDTFCFVTAGNCAGSGGGITGSGTDKQVAFFNGAGSITSETSGFGWDYDTNQLSITGTADGTDAITVTLGDILITDGDFDLSSGDFNVTLDSADTANFTGTQPASVGTTPGTSASAIIGLSAAIGGNTTIATTGTGGVGSGINWALGTGGTAALANTASTGGAGGAYLITSGTGGAAAATGTNVGGAGGSIVLTSGAGGAASGGSSNTGGNGGALSLVGGNAGSGGNANGGFITINPGAPSGSGSSQLNLGTINVTLLNLGDAATTKTLDIGGVDTDGTDTIRIASGTTADDSADIITIGNANTSTTMALTGGDDWSITAAGNATFGGDLAVNGATSADITTTTTTATIFNSTATTLSLGGAATTLNIGPTGSGASSVLVSGGSADTGCTVDGSNGNLTCSGSITGSATGTSGFWSRTGTTLTTATANDNVTIDGTTTLNGDVDMVFAGSENATITNTTNTLGASGMLDLASTSSTTNTRTLDLLTTFTSTGATTSYGLYNNWTSSAVVTGASVSQSAYGIFNTVTKTGADDATGTYSLIASHNTASNTGRTDTGIVDTYGGYFTATGDTAGTSSSIGLYTAALGTDIGYGLFIANSTATTDYGVYQADSSDDNYFAGNVGIGDSTPSAPLEVGNGTDSLQVSSVGDLTFVDANDGASITGPAGGALTVTAAATGLNLQSDGSVDVNLAGGSAATGCTLTNSTGDFTCTGNITGSSGALASTLQNAYDNSTSPATIELSSTDDSLVFSNANDGNVTDGANVLSIVQSVPAGATTALDITQSSNAADAVNIIANSIDTENALDISVTGLTSGTGAKVTGSGATMTTGGELIDLVLGANTVGAGVTVTSTGAYTGIGAADGLINVTANSLTSGYGTQFFFNGLTSGRGLNLSSTSTALTSGNLAYIDWSPGSATTATTADLFRINLGSNGTLATGNLFNILDSSSSIFSVSEVAMTTSLPANFTAAGDVSIAYDINFTNPTASFIKSAAPFAIQAGETFNSSDLTLQTYNAGSVVIQSGSITSTSTTGLLNLVALSDTSSFIGFNLGFTMDDGVTADANLYASQINLTQNDVDGDMFGLQISNLATSAAVGTDDVECLLCIDNVENTALLVNDAIRITNSGGTDTAIAAGIDFDATGIVDDIILQNDETINNDVNGTVLIEDGGTTTLISVNTTTLQLNLSAQIATGQRICHDGADAAAGVQTIGDCSATQADMAEYYGSDGTLEAGDVVTLALEKPSFEITTATGSKTSKAFVTKSSSSYQQEVVGIISTNPFGEVLGEGVFDPEENPKPVALSGRVPVKVSTENGPILIGDYLTSSSLPGVAMKATHPGPTLGKALESFNSQEVGKIITFVNISYADPQDFFASLSFDEEGNLIIPNLKTEKLIVDSELQIKASDLAASTNQNQYIDLSGKIATLEERIAQLEQQLASSNSNQDSIPSDIPENNSEASSSALLADNESTSSADFALAPEATNSATPSADIALELNLTPPDGLLASSSASLANLDVSQTISTLDLNVSGIFKSLGEAFLGKTTIAGDLTVDGTFSITEGSKLNAFPTLYIQDSPLAESVDLFNGQVVIEKDGTLTAKTLIADQIKVTKDKSAGQGFIKAGKSEVAIFNSLIENDSMVIITPETVTLQPLIVSAKVQGSGFVVSLSHPEVKDIKFSYLIIGQKTASVNNSSLNN